MLSITSTDFSIQNEPEGLRDLKHRVYFAKDLNGYLEEWNGDLVFIGEDYTYLRRKYIDEGCAIIPVTLNDGCGRSYDANLFLNEAEWRPDICSVTLGVVDAGFLSLIDNNMSIKAYLNVPRSKNDVDISAYTTVQTDLTFEASAIADPDVTSREGVRVYDAYKMLIAFMTDGLLEFESNFLFPDDSESELLSPVLITAKELREGNSSPLFPYISFEDFHRDMAKLYHLSFNVIDGVFRVEPESYFQQSSSVLVLENANEVTQESDKESFYAKVQFGSQSDEKDTFDYYPNITFLGFSREEYHLGGQCNNKGKLDLRMEELITDTNVIMQSLPIASGGATDPKSKEEDIFIVTCDSNNVTQVYPHPTDSLLQYYNKLLTNFEVATRWGDGVPFPIFQFLGENQNGARGYNPSAYPVSLQVVNALSQFGMANFTDRTLPEGFDPNSNMSDVTDALNSPKSIDPSSSTVTDTQTKTIYTAPTNSVYTVITSVRTTFVGAASAGSVYLLRYDGLNQGVIDEAVQLTPTFSGGVYNFELSWTVYLDAGDRVAVGVVNIPEIIQDSFFQVNDLDFIEKTYSPEDNYLIRTTFSYPIAPEQWHQFLDDRHGEITVTHQNGMIKGFLSEASRNFEDGITEWKIRSTFGDS